MTGRVFRPFKKWLQRLKRKTWNTIIRQWIAWSRRSAILPHAVLYESFSGEGMLCNPEAIFRELLSRPAERDFLHVWVLKPGRRYAQTRAEFRSNRNVKFVRPYGFGYYRYLHRAKFVVNNATFPARFNKRPEQIYLNTWHGTPIKHMGYDIPGDIFGTRNVSRNFSMADYLLSTSPFMTQQMYLSAYKMRDFLPGTILEEGYPRIDHQFGDGAPQQRVRARLAQQGIDLAGRKIILYAPTWKGHSFYRPENDLDELTDVVAQLQHAVDASEYVVLIKIHQAMWRYVEPGADINRVLVPNDIPTNALLGIADVLVSDYSSIIVDFFATGRPVVYYTPDAADYGDYRGFYVDPAKLPGTVATTRAELAAAVVDAIQGPGDAEALSAAQQQFNPHEDGHAAARIVDIVFEGEPPRHAVADTEDGRRRVLVYLGGLKPNGITSSAVNAVNHLDLDRLDVTVFYNSTPRRGRVDVEEILDPRIRHVLRVGSMGGGHLELAAVGLSYLAARHGRRWFRELRTRHFHDEWTRCFGGAQFDVAIDLSGYGPMYAELVAQASGAYKAIWLHNDLMAEVDNPGRKAVSRNLRAVFSVYEQYDVLISVSAALNALNQANLHQWAPAATFTSVPNLVDFDRIDRLLASTDEHNETFVDQLQAEHDAGEYTFITVGRLSPEKNQRRLLEAFAEVHAEHPRTTLMIVGFGPLRGELESAAVSLGLSEAVTFTGMLRNPFALMRRADCFVLSSDYEGQPMVLLEALAVGIPIVTTRFTTVADVVDDTSARIVEQTPAALAAGMADALAGRIPQRPFSGAAYNAAALLQLETVTHTGADIDATAQETDREPDEPAVPGTPLPRPRRTRS